MTAGEQIITVADLLNSGACFDGVMRFVCRTRLIAGKIADLLALASESEQHHILLAAGKIGYGNGYGDGEGNGNGYGNGYGDGEGNGYGNGNGNGYGYGYGDGDGYGYGNGDGYGYGNGYGYGYGDGDGGYIP